MMTKRLRYHNENITLEEAAKELGEARLAARVLRAEIRRIKEFRGAETWMDLAVLSLRVRSDRFQKMTNKLKKDQEAKK